MTKKKDAPLSDMIVYMFGFHFPYDDMYKNLGHEEECSFTLYDMITDTGRQPSEVSVVLGTMITQELIRWDGVTVRTITDDSGSKYQLLDPRFHMTTHGIFYYYGKWQRPHKREGVKK